MPSVYPADVPGGPGRAGAVYPVPAHRVYRGKYARRGRGLDTVYKPEAAGEGSPVRGRARDHRVTDGSDDAFMDQETGESAV